MPQMKDLMQLAKEPAFDPGSQWRPLKGFKQVNAAVKFGSK